MKEDILEQLVDEYFQLKGYFTQHNIKFRPDNHKSYDAKYDSVHSDIDVLAIHPTKKGFDKVIAVSCKSWQSGLRTESKLKEFKIPDKPNKRASWKYFRELTNDKWADAFINKIKEVCGTDKFTHYTAVTLLKGDKSVWENYPLFKKNLKGNPVKIITLEEILNDLAHNVSTTPSNTMIGRFLQLVRAARLDIK